MQLIWGLIVQPGGIGRKLDDADLWIGFVPVWRRSNSWVCSDTVNWYFDNAVYVRMADQGVVGLVYER